MGAEKMKVWCCVGSGPSLTPNDLDFVRAQGWNIATVNMGFTIMPDAKIFHAMDSGWWERYGQEAMETLNPNCEHWSGSLDHANQYKANYLTWDGNQGYSKVHGHCHGGKLSGLQLINIVGWKNPDLVILLGYDNKPTLQRHWHPNYPKGMKNGGIVDQKEGDYAKIWSEAPFHLFNCSRDTNIEGIPRMKLEDVPEYASGQANKTHA